MINMHSYLIRMREELFNYVKMEADNRGVSINFFISYCIEVALLKLINDAVESDDETIKNKAKREERKRLRNE